MNFDKRIYWIDYLKAITMFMVVLGHSGLDDDSILKTWIYGFHMPLFIFASGYFVRKSRSVFDELKNDIKTLCIPYLFFSIFLIPFYYIIQRLSGEHIAESPFLYIAKRLLMDDFYHCGPIWFLGALLVIKSFFNALLGLFEKGLNATSIANLAMIAGVLTLLMCDFHAFSVKAAFALLPYYIAGAGCSRLISKIKSKRIVVYASIGGLILYSIISVKNVGIDYDQLKFGDNTLVTYMEGLLGCFSMTMIFSCLSRFKIESLRDIGMNTLTILGFHSIFIQVFRFLYKRAFSDSIPLWYLATISLVSFMGCYGISLLIIRICPYAIGRKSKSKKK